MTEPAAVLDPPRLTRAEAARLNGARSRGPVTPEGKARSSRNALKHGLAAETFTLLPGEDPQAFAGLHADLVARYAPCDPVAGFLVRRLAVAMWRLLRAERLEAEVHTTRERRRDPSFGSGYNPHSPEAWDAGRLSVVSRYEGQHERTLLRTLHLLEEHEAVEAPAGTLAEVPEPEMPDRHLWHPATPRNEPEAPTAAAMPEPEPDVRRNEPERPGRPAPADEGSLPLSIPVRQELERLLAGDDWDGLERFIAAGHLRPIGLGPEDVASARAVERTLFARGAG